MYFFFKTDIKVKAIYLLKYWKLNYLVYHLGKNLPISIGKSEFPILKLVVDMKLVEHNYALYSVYPTEVFQHT